MKSQFQAICEAAATALQAAEGLPPGMAVVAYERGAIESEIERSLAELSLCVVVLPFETLHSIPGTVPPFYDEAELTVHAVENPALNSTGVDSTWLRDTIVATLAGEDFALLAEPLSEHTIRRADLGDHTVREITFKARVQMQ